LSYTNGYLSNKAALLIDLTSLNGVVEINREDRYVVVETGLYWADLDAALEPLGLRTPYWGPLSGLLSTVGGALSQGSIFLGSGLYGSVGDSVLGIDVVTSNGELIRTGSAGAGNTPAFMRYFGPDLTGLFVGDAGALGIKVRATLRLIPRPKVLEFLSFEYADSESTLRAMAEVSRQNLASECFGFDPYLAEVRMRRASLFADAKVLANVVKQSGMIAGAKLVLGGRNFLKAGAFSAHAIVEADSEAALNPRVKMVREIMSVAGKEVKNSIPKAMRSTPFAAPDSMLGPDGERWVPVHGIVPHSKAVEAIGAVQAIFEKNREKMQIHNIKVGFLLCTVLQQASLIEPVFFWPDSHTEYHKRVVDTGYLKKIGEPPDNPDARAVVGELKRAVADTLRAMGATHFQIGKFYNYRDGRDPVGLALFDAIKNHLDPDNLMNPGALR
jgi:FAD/FMN-containing dehydrogenase